MNRGWSINGLTAGRNYDLYGYGAGNNNGQGSKWILNAANEITDAVDVDCETEAQAFAAAWDLADGGKIEIWQGKRKVGVWEGGKAQATRLLDIEPIRF